MHLPHIALQRGPGLSLVVAVQLGFHNKKSFLVFVSDDDVWIKGHGRSNFKRSYLIDGHGQITAPLYYAQCMPAKVRYGVLSTANIALKKVISGMQQSPNSEIVAIASREFARARQAAAAHNIPKAYGSYEALLEDPEIDAVYIPLPNDQHVLWAIKALEARKHVLCEKPIGINVSEVHKLIAARDRASLEGKPMKVAEAYMVAVHPQWLRARDLVAQQALGDLRLIQGNFSYFNRKPENIRNSLAAGGGALMDIGCYLVFFARFLFSACGPQEDEPTRVLALIDRDPDFGIDRLTTLTLEFPNGRRFTGTCSTQLVPAQRIEAFGTTGRLDIEIPVNTPTDAATRILLNGTPESFGPLDQYTLQADAFSRAILENTPIPVPLEDSLRIMDILDALFLSARTNQWQTPAV